MTESPRKSQEFNHEFVVDDEIQDDESYKQQQSEIQRQINNDVYNDQIIASYSLIEDYARQNGLLFFNNKDSFKDYYNLFN